MQVDPSGLHDSGGLADGLNRLAEESRRPHELLGGCRRVGDIPMLACYRDDRCIYSHVQPDPLDHVVRPLEFNLAVCEQPFDDLVFFRIKMCPLGALEHEVVEHAA